jgi:hypothetical protein
MRTHKIIYVNRKNGLCGVEDEDDGQVFNERNQTFILRGELPVWYQAEMAMLDAADACDRGYWSKYIQGVGAMRETKYYFVYHVKKEGV